MKTIEYENTGFRMFRVSIDAHCEDVRRLAKKKAFIGMYFKDERGNFLHCSATTRVPPCGPSELLVFHNGVREGWLIYEWRIVAGGICLSLYNPQTAEITKRYQFVCEMQNQQAHFRFYVPRNNLPIRERLGAISHPTMRYHLYDVEMGAHTASCEDEHIVNIVVTEQHKNTRHVYQFLSTVLRGKEHLLPETVFTYEYTDF